MAQNNVKTFPRILFVTPVVFNKVSGGGITFTNLFQGWPKGALATIHNDSHPPSDDVCNQYYRLSESELDLIPFLRFLRKIFKPRSSIPSDNIGDKRTAAQLVPKWKSFLKTIVGDSFPERACLTTDLDDWIEKFQPDIIYTILGSNGMMSLIRAIHDRFEVPLVVHIMDDWISSYHRAGLFSTSQRRLMHIQIRDLFNRADKCLGISPAMCEEYVARYGKPFQAFQNTIDVSRWSVRKRDASISGDPVEILYTGSIFENAQLEALEDCCKAVAKLNSEGSSITLSISSPSDQSAKFEQRLRVHSAILMEPPLESDELFFRRLASADILLLPVNFSENSVRFIRYSMPTKVPAYLTSGTPILAYGPKGTAQIDYAISEKWARVVANRDLDELSLAIVQITEDTKLRASLSKRAIAVARQNHDAVKVRTDFQNVISHCVGNEAY